jgi:hypothetical protein
MASTVARSQVELQRDRRELEARFAHLTAVELDARERLRPMIDRWRCEPHNAALVEDCCWQQNIYERAAEQREQCEKQLAKLVDKRVIKGNDVRETNRTIRQCDQT